MSNIDINYLELNIRTCTDSNWLFVRVFLLYRRLVKFGFLVMNSNSSFDVFDDNGSICPVIRCVVRLRDGISVEAYYFPDYTFRVDISDVSSSLGFASNFLGNVTLRHSKQINILRSMGYDGLQRPGQISNSRCARMVQTLSLSDYSILVRYAAFLGKSKAKSLNDALANSTLEDRFRISMGLKPFSVWGKVFSLDELNDVHLFNRNIADLDSPF